MTNSSYSYWIWNLGLTFSLAIGEVVSPEILVLFNTSYNNNVFAQIVPDQTLGTESSVINPNVNIEGILSDKIEGGAIRGANLFHSFDEFSVRQGQGVYFVNPVGIEHILSRVTGNSVSQILGKLGVLGNADLFLINPNGIVFGPSATLDLKGSFLATTANGLIFEDGTQFSATETSAPPLLTISIPAGLQFRESAGGIINESQVLLPVFGSGLQVEPGKTLALVGGNITMPGGRIIAPRANIELGSVEGTGEVRLTKIDSSWDLSYENVQNFQDIELTQSLTFNDDTLSGISLVSTTGIDGLGGGSIQVQGRIINLTNGSQISGSGANVVVSASETVQLSGTAPVIPFPSAIASQSPIFGKEGNITINTRKLIVQNGGRITSGTSGLRTGENFEQLTTTTVSGGNLIINASESVELQGGQGTTGLFSSTESFGAAGNIIIKTGKLIVRDGAIISAESFGVDALEQPIATGAAGNININASESLEVNGGFISTETNGLGGDGGILSINTGKLNIIDGGGVLASTTGEGRGGNILVNASDFVNLSGVDNEGAASGLFTQSDGTGTAGNITINTPNFRILEGAQVSAASISAQGGNIALQGLETLEVNNSNISASTETGSAGNLTVTAESVQITNTGSLSVEATEDGTAGNLTVETGHLSISDGAQVTVSSPEGQAGNLTINANTLSLNRGSITAETGTSQGESGANITLNISDLFRIENESRISATANSSADGGNIDIDTSFLVVFPPTGPNGSDIIANAEQGDGGRIAINAFGIFGIEENMATPGNQTNDLDASSEAGASGEIVLNREIDPNRGLVEFSETVIDPNALVTENVCRRGSKSEFAISGRGGLPPSLREDLNSEATQVGLVEPAPMDPGEATSREISAHQGSSASVSTAIVPAQGWVFNEKGEVVLVAYDPTVTGPQRLREKGENCDRP
ncbi:MAG: S-layer family protein [Crocosphaera sp.]